MALLVWFTMGIALWHFTVFLPDRFWQGIVGAFVGSVIGAIVFGLIVELIDGQSSATRPRHRLIGDPGRRDRARRRLADRRPRTEQYDWPPMSLQFRGAIGRGSCRPGARS